MYYVHSNYKITVVYMNFTENLFPIIETIEMH